MVKHVLRQARKNYLLPLLLIIGAFFWFTYFRYVTPGYLFFSDGAKFADIARNIVSGAGYGGSFKFFGPNTLEQLNIFPFPAPWVSPMMPYSIVLSFFVFGVSDFSVIATSGFFYILLVVFVFLLGKRLIGNLVGFLSAIAVLVNPNLLDYATSGASEILFALEIVAAAYLLILRKRLATIAAFAVLAFMFFTRPQAILVIVGYFLLWLLLRFRTKKALWVFLTFIVGIILVDRIILKSLGGQFFLYSPIERGIWILIRHASESSTSTILRGANPTDISYLVVIKRVFYNLYNFYRLLPQIVSPYIWGLFLIGLFKWGKDKVEDSLKIVAIFMVVATFLVTALTIPFFRYIHPILPLVCLFAITTLVWIVKLIVGEQWRIVKKNEFIRKLGKDKLVTGISTLLILFFVVGQTLGVIFLDSRFKAARTNRGKPPVYAKLSYILRDNTESEDIIITNLDTWGSWYGERKTVWFPLKLEQLISPNRKEIPFDAIYLTSYLMDDENYYMGEEWRKIFYNPESLDDQFISDNFILKGVYQISADDTYENQEAKAILLMKK